MNTPPSGEEWRAFDAPSDLLPRTSADDDALRAARVGIEAHRKTDVSLLVLRANGAPLANADLLLEQTRHAFPFGDQLWGLDAMARHGEWDTDRARAWRRRFAEVFNAATNLCYWTERPRNDASKTEDVQGEPRLDAFARTVDWTLASGLLAKGHPLFWSIPKCIPEWAKRYDFDTFWKFAEVRVRSLVARFRGRIRLWDAVNEALWEAAPWNLPRRQWPHIESVPDMVRYISPVLRWCREEDPDATFLLNDYGTEDDSAYPAGSDGSAVTAASQRARYIALARALADAGTPPDALGLQSHTGRWASPSSQRALYDEFAAAGLRVHITEFWADLRLLRESGRYAESDLEAARAQHILDFLTVAFGHPAVDAFFFWGFLGAAIRWDARYSGHEPLPLWDAVRHLLHEEWHTRLALRTDATGRVSFRGFKGDYVLRRPLGPAFKGVPFRADGSAPSLVLTL